MDPTAPHIRVGAASGQPMTSTGTCELVLPQIPSDFPNAGHGMPGSQENLVSVVAMCDTTCTVILSKHAVNIYSPNGNPLSTGWSEPDGPRLWHMSILPKPSDVPLLSLDPESH